MYVHNVDKYSSHRRSQWNNNGKEEEKNLILKFSRSSERQLHDTKCNGIFMDSERIIILREM